MNKSTSLLCAVALACTGVTARAYEPSTHEILSSQAAQRSRIYADTLLEDLGLPAVGTAMFTARDLTGTSAGDRSADALIGYGARLEDYYETNCNLDAPQNTLNWGWMRVFNHFFDPQHGGAPLSVLGTDFGRPSPAWALEDTGETTTILAVCALAGRAQTYSYRQGQEQLLTLLTAANQTQRDAAAASVLQTLGHIVHHVQDMAQPQHSRNDRHSKPAQAWYERYTELFVNSRITAPAAEGGILASNPYPIPVFATARQYWHTVGASGAYVGMAEFTSNNYVTFGTQFRSVVNGSGQEQILSNANYPLPSGTNADGTQKFIVSLPQVTVRAMDNTLYQGPMDAVVGDVFDGYALGHHTGKVLAATSLLDNRLRANGKSRVFAMNSFVYEDNYSIVLPRAVAFSAGLINHFFAGKLALHRASSGSGWIIDNVGTEAMTGTFSLYAENTSGQRSIVSNGVWGGTLAVNASTPTALPEPPAGTIKLIAVFDGNIGSESSLRRVAGKVISYTPTPPTVACEVSPDLWGPGMLVRSGSDPNHPVSWVFEAGSTPGDMELYFGVEQNSASISVVSENSAHTVLLPTAGTIGAPSYDKRRFNFQPASLGSTRIRFTVAGNSSSRWTASSTCPGQASMPDSRTHPRKLVTFRFGSALQGAGGNCQATFYVDGERVGLAYVSPSGGTTLTKSLYSNATHIAEFRSYSCAANTTNILVGSSYTDSTGTYNLQNMSSTQLRAFSVN